MNLGDLFGGGGGKLRYQDFLASGTFTPSAALLANGGRVYVEMAGGGGSGGAYDGSGPSVAGGGGSSYWQGVVAVSGAVSVIVGAGGAKPTALCQNGQKGGTTTFGSVSVDGGFGGAYTGVTNGGAGSGLGMAGNSSSAGGQGGGFGGGGFGRPDGAPYSGGGGAGGTTAANAGAGGSGFVRVSWSE